MAVIKNNLIPIFCDIDKSYFNIDPEKLPNLITKKQRPFLLQIFSANHVILIVFKK